MGDLQNPVTAIVEPVVTGQLTPDQAIALGGIVKHALRAFEMLELNAWFAVLPRRAADYAQ